MVKNEKVVLIVVPTLGGGGQERMAINTYNVLKNTYDVKIVIYSSTTNDYVQDKDVIDIDQPPKASRLGKIINQIQRCIKLRKIKKKLKPFVSFSIGESANMTNVLSRTGESIITSIRNYDKVKRGIIDTLVYRLSDCVVCISNGLKKEFDEVFPKYKNKSFTLYNGLDTNNIRKMSLVESDIPIKGNYIVAMGRLHKQKGYSHLLSAFAKVIQNIPNESLVIIGKGEQEETLRNKIAEYKLEERVILLGFKSNPYMYLRNADAFIMTSLYEGFCNAIVEAMACGLPVVSTNCYSGPPEILGNEENIDFDSIEYAKYGILTPRLRGDDDYEREEFLAKAILQIITDKEINKKYRIASLKRATDFDISAYEDSLKSLIERLGNPGVQC